MSQFSVVSVDMFGTLVNPDTVAASVWQIFLKDGYTPELGKRYWNRATELVFQNYDRAIQERRYIPPKVLYEQCYTELFREIGLNYDPKEAARTLAIYHSHSEPFADSSPFLDSVGKKYLICLSSDTDDDMLGRLLELYPFDKILTSEELGTFKTGVGGRFFSAVVGHYDIQPSQIIHIGDSLSDIIGASEAGIVTCWINRKGRTWAHDIKPDYEVKTLIEAASVLGVTIDSDPQDL